MDGFGAEFNNKEADPKEAKVSENIPSLKQAKVITLDSATYAVISDLRRMEKICSSNDIDSILKKIQSYYHVIEAAGGLITNQNNETLMIYRRGKWDLPKGKIEKDESIKSLNLKDKLTALKDLENLY